jgi:hypothetical protein
LRDQLTLAAGSVERAGRCLFLGTANLDAILKSGAVKKSGPNLVHQRGLSRTKAQRPVFLRRERICFFFEKKMVNLNKVH